MNKRIYPQEIRSAYLAIKGDILKTPLEYSPELSRISGANVFLKMECQQLTGSFKLRGVCHKIKNLKRSDFKKTFIASSTGNHAAAFAYCSQKFDFKGKLFLPETIRKAKQKALEKYPIDLIKFGRNSVEAEAKATCFVKEISGVLIHPYNDIDIIKGQGTVGVEIQEQFPKVDTVLAPIGGGGLISGLCSFFDDENVQVIGCQPENACEMKDSVEKGFIVAPSTKETIADATAGGIEKDSLTYEICKNQLNGFELVSEKQIQQAVAFMANEHQCIIEPGAALPVAVLLNSSDYQNKNVVLVLTGKKIDSQLLTKILIEHGDCNK
jgi:threonine dehydratase